MGGPIDSSAAFIHLRKAQSVLGYKQQQVTGLRLAVTDVFQAHQIALAGWAKQSMTMCIFLAGLEPKAACIKIYKWSEPLFILWYF